MKARAEHYRKKAEQTRIIAEAAEDPETKRFLLTVSSDYLMLADLMERLAMTDPLPASE